MEVFWGYSTDFRLTLASHKLHYVPRIPYTDPHKHCWGRKINEVHPIKAYFVV
jgi:hypothetical protein